MIYIVRFIIIVSVLTLTPIIYAQEISEKKICTVINVIDGDTISVFLEGQEESIRLIGIDTPESWENEKVIRDAQRYGIEVEEMIALGKIATTFVEVLINPLLFDAYFVLATYPQTVITSPTYLWASSGLT